VPTETSAHGLPEKKKTDWASRIGSPTAQFAAVLSLFNLFYSHAYYSDEPGIYQQDSV
jgi:hypothetical protein